MLEASQSTPPQRVKVYRLNNEGKWDDKGTGHVTIQLLEQANCPGLVVVSEDDHRPLLLHRIAKEDIYHRRADDTIITWSDSNMGTDIALSFAEDVGCNLIWDNIQRLQEGWNRPESPTRRRVVDQFEGGFDDIPEGGAGGPISLPPADLSSLPELAKALNDVSFLHRETLAGQLMSTGYPRKILDLFRQCEDLEDLPSLHQLHVVVKGMILLGDTTLLESLLMGDNFADVVGALEYEPGLVHPPRHREFLQQHVVFKEVVPIADPAVKQRIHQTYQIGYLKDVVLPRVLDDQTFAALSSLMLFYNHDVLTSLQADPSFFPDLFDALRTTPPTHPRWRDLVRLLQELCSQAKHLQPNHRQQLLARLISLGLFDIIGTILQHGDPGLQNKAVDILVNSVAHDPSTLRAHMVQEGGKHLFSQLLQLMITSGDAGLQEQILEMMRMLLDPENEEQPHEKNAFLELFYGEPMDRLIQPLHDLPPLGSTLHITRTNNNTVPAPHDAVGTSGGGGDAAAGGGDATAPAAAGVVCSNGARSGGAAVNGEQPTAVTTAGAGATAGGTGDNDNKNDNDGGAAPVPSSTTAAAPTSTAKTAAGGVRKVSARTLGVIAELLCFCVQHHGYRVKFYILKNNVVCKVLKLLARREAWLVVTAIRFVRACVALKDDFYYRHFTRFNLFAPLVDVFLANGDRYNLLNSAVLELMEYIRKENIKLLIEHIVQEFYPRLEHIEYVDTFKMLKTRYEQNHEQQTSTAAATASQPATQPIDTRGPGDARALDRNEEDYFNEEEEGVGLPRGGDGGGSRSSDEELGASPLPPLQLPSLPRLVDYDDDEEEDDLLAGRNTKHPPPNRPSSPSAVKRPRTQEGANGLAQGGGTKGVKIALSLKTSGTLPACSPLLHGQALGTVWHTTMQDWLLNLACADGFLASGTVVVDEDGAVEIIQGQGDDAREQ